VTRPEFWLCLLDQAALVDALRQVTGRRFIGVVNDDYSAELVFEDGPPGSGNLVTVFSFGHWAGRVSFGGVTDPYGYAAAYAEFGPGDET
jgi:hypothetical protein